MKKILLFTLCIFLLSSCGKRSKVQSFSPSDSILTLHYARGFRVAYHPDYKKVEILMQNNQQVIERYYLVRDAQTQVPKDGTKIIIPLSRIAVGSNTHLEALTILNQQNSIVGICSPHLVYNDTIQNRFSRGQIVDLGDAFSLNLEKLIFLKPDVIFLSGFDAGQQDSNQRIMQTGIPIISNNEWKETTLLGRAEWLKFMAVFFDKELQATSYFNHILLAYKALTQKVDSMVIYKPNVMLGGGFKGTWYVPSGRSFMSQLLQDAGANYAFCRDTTYESLPLSFEAVLYHFSSANIWIGAPAETLSELSLIDERYSMFPPTTSHQVYNFNARKKTTGANDFWESGVMHPELILSDLIKIFHPQILPNYKLFYAKQLTD